MTTTPPTGQPRGIYTLFLTEMWERMSFYGMKVLLVLYMVDHTRGGKGYTDEAALAIFGLYGALVYVAALPGGWIGDRLLGARRSVWWGGVLIACGHLLLGIERDVTFYSGLLFIAFGSGMLKPNISVMVAQLYPEGGARRDGGFTLFYMGINVGVLIGQIVCSNLGELLSWRWGFSAAAAGMIFGLLQFHLSRKHIAHIGGWQPQPGQNVRRDWMLLIGGLSLAGVVAALVLGGVVAFDAVAVSRYTSLAILLMAVLFYGWAFLFARLTPIEMKRMAVNVILFIAAVLFYTAFAQGASSILLFVDRLTVRQFGDITLAAGMFQALNPLMVLAFSPPLVLFWGALSKRNIEPMLATKLAIGLLLLAASFGVAALAAARALSVGPVWLFWLVGIYVFMTLAELFINPVGLSAVTKLAPERLASRMMGIWFLAASLGYVLSGLIAGKITADNASHMPERFLQISIGVGLVGLVLLLCSRWIQRLSPGVK